MYAYILAAIVALISYLIGSVNFSILLSRIIGKKDIRESGSGNAGATNMLRTYGKKMGVITLLLDVAKGVVVIILAFVVALFIWASFATYDKITGEIDVSAVPNMICDALPYVAGVFVILGHNFPVYFGFKGGKGVATSLGVVMMLNWKVGLIVMIIALAIMAITRYVSLGSIIGGALYIILGIFSILYPRSQFFSTVSLSSRMWAAAKSAIVYPPDLIKIICIIIIGGLLIVRHHANIKRLINGTENKLGAKKEDK